MHDVRAPHVVGGFLTAYVTPPVAPIAMSAATADATHCPSVMSANVTPAPWRAVDSELPKAINPLSTPAAIAFYGFVLAGVGGLGIVWVPFVDGIENRFEDAKVLASPE